MSAASPTTPPKAAATPAASPNAATPAKTHTHHVPVLSLEGKAGAQLELPEVFSSPVRVDLVRRAVQAARANRRQPYGPNRKAGMQHSVEWSGKGHGVSRTPRLMDGSMTGAQAPNTVGGRAAHPPRPDALYARKINQKERQRALASALAATREARFALERGHEVPPHAHLPFVLDDALEGVENASRAREVLQAAGLWADVERAATGIHIRAGKGKLRGRTRRHPRSLLVVVSAPGKARGFRNFPGVDVVPLDSLGTEHLAPGGVPGRLTLFTPASIKGISARFGPSHPLTALPARPAVRAAPKGGRAE